MDLRQLRDAMRRAAREGLPPASARAYLFAVACVGVAALAHFAIAQLSADITPSILYNPAVFVAALIGGTRAGLIAAGMSGVLVWWTFDARYLGGRMNTLTPALNCALYICAAGVIIWVAARYRAFARHERGGAHDAADAMGAGTAAASLPGRRGPWWPPGLAPNSLAGYVVALAAIAIATLIRHGFAWLGGEMLPLVSYYPAVLLAALTGGAAAGLLAMLASLVVVWSEFPAPWLSFGPITREESVGLALYVFASLLTVWLAENHRHAWRGDDLPQPAVLQWATPILVAFAAVLLTTLVLLAVDSYLAPDHLVLGYLLAHGGHRDALRQHACRHHLVRRRHRGHLFSVSAEIELFHRRSAARRGAWILSAARGHCEQGGRRLHRRHPRAQFPSCAPSFRGEAGRPRARNPVTSSGHD